MTESSSPLSAGMIVAQTYDIERLLGKGGMGEVWLARHLRLAGKQVAIKVLRVLAQNPSAELLSRFRREAEIAARLEHPNIVQVLDFNQLPSGEPYLVMEFLKGQSLADRLKQSGGSMHPTQVQGIVLQVGSALQTAHAAGVVHRDLKPDNIFLVPTALGDQIKVLDFGISKLSQAGTLQTTEQTLLGTPLYMSPEQALGQNRDTNAQSDIFSLGSICYELLSGTAPFIAESIAQVVFRIAYQPHLPLQQVVAGVPPNVVNAVEHALVKDRAARTPNIATFIRELTGEELTSTGLPKEGPSGVYSPGMSVSDSLMMNQTVAPVAAGTGTRSKVTPFSKSVQGVKQSQVALKPASKLPWLGLGLVVVTAFIVGAIASLKTHGSKSPLVEAPTLLVVDAGVARVVEVIALVIDAGAPMVSPPPIVEPTTPTLPPKQTEAPIPPEELQYVAQLNQLKQNKKWERLHDVFNSALLHTTSNAGRRAIFMLDLEASCAVNALAQIRTDYNRISGLNDRSAAKAAVTVCRKYLPDWEP